MTRPRCTFTVLSAIPRAAPICLLGNPCTTPSNTSRSRAVSRAIRRAISTCCCCFTTRSPAVAAAVTTGASGANTVTVAPADAALLAVGMRVSGAGVAANATVTAVNPTTGVVTLSANNTAAVTALTAVGALRLNNVGVLRVGGDLATASAWLASNRLDQASTGTLALVASTAETINLNSGAFAGLMIGAAAPATLSTPFANFTNNGGNFRFGGGGSTLTVATDLTGANNLVIGATGATGTVVLTGANNYTGTTTVAEGSVLRLGTPSALGAASTGSTIAAGATVDLNGQSTSEPFTAVSGYGVGGRGAFVNTSATPATVLGRITGGGSYVVGGAGDITLAAQTGGGTITKNGAGTLTLGTAQDTFDNDSVAVVVNAGRVVLAKPSTTTIHALGGTSTVNAGILQLAGTGPDQLFYGMQLKLNGGLLDLNGRNGVVDNVVNSEHEAFEQARRFLSYLPANVDEAPPIIPSASSDWCSSAPAL